MPSRTNTAAARPFLSVSAGLNLQCCAENERLCCLAERLVKAKLRAEVGRGAKNSEEKYCYFGKTSAQVEVEVVTKIAT